MMLILWSRQIIGDPNMTVFLRIKWWIYLKLIFYLKISSIIYKKNNQTLVCLDLEIRHPGYFCDGQLKNVNEKNYLI